MTWQSGSGGGISIPGLTSDGLIPGGIDVAGGVHSLYLSVAQGLLAAFFQTDSVTGAITAGDGTASLKHQLFGNVSLENSTATTGDDVLDVSQDQPLTGNSGAQAIFAERRGALNGHVYTDAAVRFDSTVAGDTTPILDLHTENGKVVSFGHGGGMGIFGTVAPDNPSVIDGALSTVADPAAQAVLTSIIAALVADGGATNGTT